MAREQCRKRPNDQHGAVALEFVIVLPLLVALLMGIVTAGLGYNNVLGLADGVREGARFGATTPNTSAWGATVQQQTIDLTALNRTGHVAVVASSMVCAQLVKAPTTIVQGTTNCPGAGPAPANPASVPAGTCLVKVWGKIPVTLTFILIPTQTIQVERHSVSLYERGPC